VFLSSYFKVWVKEASEARDEMLEKEAEAAKAESKPTPTAKGGYRNSLTDSTDDGSLDEGP